MWTAVQLVQTRMMSALTYASAAVNSFEIYTQEAFEKCWAHSLLRTAVTLPVTRCR